MTMQPQPTTVLSLGPGWLTFILVGVVIVGGAFEPTRPLAMALLALILFGLLLNGYGEIHSTFNDILTGKL